MFIKCRFLYVYNSIRGEWLKESFSKGQKEIIFKCFKEGYSYHDIALLCDKQFNIHVTDDCIRKMIRRNGYSTPRKDERSMCLVMSDMHIPYNRDDILDIVAKYRETINTIILGGDIIDCESISVYKSLGKVELVDEMREAWNLLKDIQDMTPGVKPRPVIQGRPLPGPAPGQPLGLHLHHAVEYRFQRMADPPHHIVHGLSQHRQDLFFHLGRHVHFIVPPSLSCYFLISQNSITKRCL